MQITIRQLRQLISECARSVNEPTAEMMTEATRREQPPAELMALVGKLPMKITRNPHGTWFATAKFSEKKRAEQGKMSRAWDRIVATLSKKPWIRAGAERGGWNGQTDTGGNFSSGRLEFKNRATNLHISLSDHVSFKTGSKEWTISAWMPTAEDAEE